MTQDRRDSSTDTNPVLDLFTNAAEAFEDVSKVAADWAEGASNTLQELLERSTETAGDFVTATRNNPVMQSIEKVPGLNLLPKALGDVDPDSIAQEIAELKQKHPTETPAELAHRIIVDTAIQAGTIGLLTNIVPPLALTLFAVDIAAITKLQSEMVYRIAAAYGLPLEHSARRGEVLAIFGLSFGGSGALKSGLSFVELIPGVGAVVGATSNASLIYVLGQVASVFYDAKVKGKTISAEDLRADGRAYRQEVDAQQAVMDQVLTHMVMVSYPNEAKSDLLPVLEKLSLSSSAVDLDTLPPVETLLTQLKADFAEPLAIQCYKVALSTGEITPEEQALLDKITGRFNLSPQACREAAASSIATSTDA
ncbi:MAG: hypothetical protein AAF289_15960 [Cyanobacteria bacterium P01_A01_bin.135]